LSSKNRYVAISPTRIDDRKKFGPAWSLHEFLVDHQTDADGNVHYGRAISYAWIRSRWQEAPTIRTLKRHMARLKSAGKVYVERAGWDDGMRVRVLGSAKWPQAPRQIPLFPPPEILSISRGKDVRNLSKPPLQAGTKVSPQRGQKCPRNDVKKHREEKTNCEALAFARPSSLQNAAALNERRRLLWDQARLLEKKYKTSG
jgi:hypothetical protein